jgi:hypothetical protein
MAKRTLHLSKIRLDGNTQPRVELEESLISEYEEAYKTGIQMPPLEVMFDGASYWLWDGFHRRWGADRAGLDKLPCNVTNGTREDAQWASYGANVTHGLRRSNGDKAKAVKAALRHPKGPGTTDSKLAEHCGVSMPTVSKYRAELESASKILKVTTREGKDGKTYDTTNIGKTKPKPAEPVDEEPDEVDEIDTEPCDLRSIDIPSAASMENAEPLDCDYEEDEAGDSGDLKSIFWARLGDWLSEQASELGVEYLTVATWLEEYISLWDDEDE